MATHIGVDKSAYSKIEKGLRSLTIGELVKLAGIFNMTADQILHYDGNMRREVVIENGDRTNAAHPTMKKTAKPSLSSSIKC